MSSEQVQADVGEAGASECGQEINRRGFVKTFLASAAGTTVVQTTSADPLVFWATQPGSRFEDVESGPQRLRLSAAGEPLAFQNFVRSGNGWKPSTLAGVPVITGPSFPFEGKATAQGRDGKR